MTTRASSGDNPDREYYDAWSEYPDDPDVPPEITRLLREAGSGEVSMWNSKPPWCQPWTIVLSGSALIFAPTAALHLKWLSALVALPIFAWWYVFLVIAPKQYSDYVETARSYYKRR